MATTARAMHPVTGGILLADRLDEGLRVEIVTITPDLAEKWLKRNLVNRTVKRRHVAHLVQTLREGQWHAINGATIVFSDDHMLIDGQHRLLAVTESGIPITTLVVFGIKPAARTSIDTGLKRGLADCFSMAGYGNATNLAAAVTYLASWERGLMPQNMRPQALFASYDDGLTFLRSHPALEDSVRRSKTLPRLLQPAQAACLDYLFYEKDAALAAIWYNTMRTGQMRVPYEVFLTLRERLLRDKTSGIHRHILEPMVYAVKAWNHARQGKPLKVFKWHEQEPIPAIV